jgi:hypothetical protein
MTPYAPMSLPFGERCDDTHDRSRIRLLNQPLFGCARLDLDPKLHQQYFRSRGVRFRFAIATSRGLYPNRLNCVRQIGMQLLYRLFFHECLDDSAIS